MLPPLPHNVPAKASGRRLTDPAKRRVADYYYYYYYYYYYRGWACVRVCIRAHSPSSQPGTAGTGLLYCGTSKTPNRISPWAPPRLCRAPDLSQRSETYGRWVRLAADKNGRPMLDG